MENLSLMNSFKVISDPRVDRTKKHKLLDVIVIAVCGAISGCDNWVEIEDFGNERSDWFAKFLEMKNGIPSHDTFGRVFSLLDPEEFQRAFYEWTKSVFKVSEGEIIAIDGKYFSATDNLDPHTEKRSKMLLGTVNAWASSAGVALAHKRIDFDKKCEHVVIKDLIEFLNVKGCIVTMDAAGSHAETVNSIVSKGGHYCVALKDNQRLIKTQALNLFERSKDSIDSFETSEKGHGREEKRFCEAVSVDKDMHSWMKKKSAQTASFKAWEQLSSIIRVTSERTVKGKKGTEIRLYLSSLKPDARQMLKVIRSHWGIENKLHWSLDVSFNEDRSTTRKGHGSENLSLLRKYALNLLKSEKSINKSINRKRLKSAMNPDYMIKVLIGAKADLN